MGPGGADQSGVLAELLGAVCARLRPPRLAVLGAGTGNGFERIELACTRRLVAIDINPEYLALLQARHPALAPVLEVICAPVEECVLAAGAFELVHAGLLFEYTEPVPLVRRIAGWLAPGGFLSVILQLPSDQPAVTPTRFASLRELASIMRLVPPAELTAAAQAAGLALTESREVPLRSGKRFWTGLYERPR